MPSRHLSRRAFLLGGLAWGGAARAGAAPAAPVALAVVVNRANPIDDLTLAQLRNYILGRQTTWPTGKRVTVVLREPGSVERAVVARGCCRMTSAELDKLLLQAVFSGDVIGGPKSVNSASAVKKFVFTVPGAIGFLAADEVDDTVKVIRIENALPGDTTYALRAP